MRLLVSVKTAEKDGPKHTNLFTKMAPLKIPMGTVRSTQHYGIHDGMDDKHGKV